MDITRGSSDKILRPASSSRIYPNGRSLNISMELLTSEPHLPKVDTPVSLAGSHQRGSSEENKGDDRDKPDVKELRMKQQTTVESTTFFLQKCVLDPNELSGCISSSDSGGDHTETQNLKFCELSQRKLRNTKADFTCAIKNGGCKHFCRHDPPQKVVCSCAAGYRLHEDGKSCEPAVPYPCGRITAPEAKRKLTRAINTFENWNITSDDQEDAHGEVPNNITETSTAATTKITVINKTDTRVVGGTDSMRGEVPWQVHLVNSHGVGFCGASIINKKWLVTAAHCLQPGDNVTAVAGEYNTNKEDNTEQRRKVVRILPHPTYNATLNKHHNDIALLELERPLSFNSYVTPVCVGSREFTNALLKHGMGTVSGWGSTLFRGRPATVLQVLKVPYVDRPTCLKTASTTILDNMFCAGFPAGGSDTCGGDSGGPYTTEIEGTWFLTGITSWGEECAKPGKYGIYTRVSKYLKWIKVMTRLT